MVGRASGHFPCEEGLPVQSAEAAFESQVQNNCVRVQVWVGKDVPVFVLSGPSVAVGKGRYRQTSGRADRAAFAEAAEGCICLQHVQRVRNRRRLRLLDPDTKRVL